MQTTLTFKTPVAPNTIDEILRAMPRYKDDLNAMCEEYGYHEVVHAIYQAQDNLPKCVDWEYIEELLDEYLWNELIPELVVPCADTDLMELTSSDVAKAVKDASHDSRYHKTKGHVEIDITHSNAHGPEEVLRMMVTHRNSLEAVTRYYSWDEIIDAIYFAQKLFPHVDWERIEEMLDNYLWEELVPEHVFAPVQEALSNLEQVLSEVCFSNKVSFWLGSDSDIRKVLEDVIKTEAEGQNGSRIVEARIRHRLKSEPDFFNEVVYGGTCDEDFNYILRCIHGSEQNLSAEEWKEECNPWMHLTTTKQVADEYYGCDELVALIPQWNCDIVHACLMGDFNKALQQNACPYSVG